MDHSARAEPDPLGADVFAIDTRMSGYEGITSAYLLRTARPCLVETGTARSADGRAGCARSAGDRTRTTSRPSS